MNWSDLLRPYRNGSKGPIVSTYRSGFEQDFDRIIFSHPFRKLQDKTQVFPLPEQDFVHTRLTHSLEVSSVGRSLGRMVGAEVLQRHPELEQEGITAHDFGVIVAAASLAHDIGNPPFGHSGESAISEFFQTGKGQTYQEHVDEGAWSDLINFEGNAQGFRLLTSSGMKLTYPVLGAFTKYPRLAHSSPTPERRSQKKYGVYVSERDQFAQVAGQLGLTQLGDHTWCRHPLAFLVEAADDICYHIIDLEDGCTLGLVDEETTMELLRQIIGDDFNMEKYKSIVSKRERVGMLRAMAINKLIQQTTEVFLSRDEEMLSGAFDRSLVDEIPSSDILEEIIAISITKLYRSQKVVEIEAAGFEVISGLLGYFLPAMQAVHFGKPTGREKAISRLIPEEYRTDRPGVEFYEMARVCLDYVSSMTDSYALNVYRRINGMSLPRI